MHDNPNFKAEKHPLSILTKNDLQTAAQSQLGGKAANLVKLQNLGFNVPDFVVIPHDALTNLLPQTIDFQSIRTFIQNHNFENSFLKTLIAPLSKNPKNHQSPITSHHFAVRSSAVAEDSAANSFAGQFETELYVLPENLGEAVKKVWLSAYSERVQVYCQERGISSVGGISIIIQNMVAADVAGVAFGVHPTEGGRDEKVISSVYGLGEGLVSGELNADTFVVKKDGLIEKQLVNKTEGFFYSIENQRVIAKTTPSVKIAESSLDDTQIRLIAHVLDQLRLALGNPQDIEFAFQNGEFFLLQTRPITNLDKLTDRAGHRIIWDNSNIIESYPNVTTPLTFSFIIKMYDSVYRQLGDMMGVPAEEMARQTTVFENMLGLLRGRVYYNLESWYRALAMLPGYALNARYMETMMGVKERFDLDDDDAPKISKRVARWRVAKSAVKMIGLAIGLPKSRRDFKQTLDTLIAEYQQVNFDLMRPEVSMKRYLFFENFLLKRWKAPMVNDFFAMIYFGILKKQCEKLAPQNPNLHNDLLAGSQDIISTEPVRRILAISSAILDDAEATDLFKKQTPQYVWENLANFSKIDGLIKKYLHDFGERTVGELKLETITYNQEPTTFIEILQSYAAQGIRQRVGEGDENDIRSKAELEISQILRGSFLKKSLFFFLLKKTRTLVSSRENLRYERTRGFGVVRRIFSGIGKQFYAEGILDNPRDIFYLTKEEIFDFIKGTSISLKIKELVSLRKAEYAVYENEKPPSERITSFGIVYHANNFWQKSESQNDQSQITNHQSLKGLGCSAGIVKGKVRVVRKPDEVRSLNGDILVTSSTDPGWVTLFPSASAILVERGSLLSHSAIVSRELGIPCIVGVSGLLDRLKTGDLVEMNGTTGEIFIL